MASGYTKKDMTVATQTVQKKGVKGDGHQKRQKKGITKFFILENFQNSGVSFVPNTNLSELCGT